MEEMNQGLESTMIAVLDQNVPDLHIYPKDFRVFQGGTTTWLPHCSLLICCWVSGNQELGCTDHRSSLAQVIQFIHSHTVKIGKLKFCNSEISLEGKGTVKFCYTTFKLRCSLIFSINCVMCQQCVMNWADSRMQIFILIFQ